MPLKKFLVVSVLLLSAASGWAAVPPAGAGAGEREAKNPQPLRQTLSPSARLSGDRKVV